MARLLKLISILILLFVALLVGVVVFVDPNDFKPAITQQVKSATGRDLNIEGDLSFSFTPWLGIKTGALELSNAPGFGKQPFASIKSATIRVKLFPLFRKQIEMDTVSLNGLKLDLQRHKDGTSNWADLAKPSTGKQKGEAKDVQNVLGALAIGGINLSNADIMWNDQQANQRVAINNMNLSTGALKPGKPTDIEMHFNVDANNPAAKGEIGFEGTVRANPFAGSYEVSDMALNFDLQGKGVPNGQLAGKLNTDLVGDLIKQNISLKDLAANVSSKGAQTFTASLKSSVLINLKNNSVSLNKISSQIETRGEPSLDIKLATDANIDMTQQDIRLNGLKADVVARGKQLPNEQLTAALSGNVHTSLKKQNLTADKLTLTAAGLTMHGKLIGINLFSNKRRLDMPVTIERFNPRELLKTFGQTTPETADPKALSQAALNAVITLAGNDVAVNKLALMLDDSKVTGDITVKNYTRPSFNYNLIVDSLNIDRYLPPKAQRQPQKTAFSLSPINVAQAASTPEPLLPLETLRGINASGTLRVNQLVASNIHSKSITMNTSARGGIITLSPVSALLYNGRYHGNISINASKQFGDKPLISIDEKLLGISIGPLLKDLSGEERISGTANLEARLTSRGNDIDTLKRNLQGDLKSGKGAAILVNNGVYKGYNFVAPIVVAFGKAISATSINSNSKSGQTAFSQLKGSFDVSNGVLFTKDLTMTAPEFTMNQKGTVDLVQQQVNFQGGMYLNASQVYPNASAVEIKRVKENSPIPVYVKKCQFSELSKVSCYGFEFGKVLEKIGKDLIKDKLLKKIAPKPEPNKPEKPKDALKRKLLDKLFGK